ncbi:hypothetical protein JCM10908_004720 [Rhodotorula pacifica]|uniref:CCR4-NOT core subunit CAF40 n=1 Tax=Rhodotorula pacifica TaxID=1495444 RepID=UPI00317825B6
MSNASALLSALNSRPSSAAHQHQQQQQPSNGNGGGDPLSPHVNHAADPWSSSSSGHLPLSISHSINNPGLPSGVIVSSAAVNAMDRADGGGGGQGGGAAGHGRGASSASIGGLSRSETPGLPSGLVGLGGGGPGGGGGGGQPSGGGGKLLLQGGLPLAATSSLIQPGSVPGGANSMGAQSENEKVYYLIVDLMNPDTREAALLELSKKREQWDDLALVLWHSFGVMSALLQEIVSVYPLLAPPSLTAHASNRVCNALALLQCVASHNDTRSLFLSAHIPLFLYPFLNTTSKTRPFEYLRLTSLGVIGALVKQNDNSDVINFLLSTEIIPLCLRIMETGSELSKTVAIFIVQKILLDETGLSYICQTYERFYAVGTVLSSMVQQLVETQAVRLLKHVVRCYLRLSDNLRAREALRACLPEPLRDATFSPLLKGDMVTKRCLATLLLNLSDRVEGA